MKYQRYSSGLRQYAERLRSTDYNDLTPISQNWLSEISDRLYISPITALGAIVAFWENCTCTG
ncbi:hypothetical protein [Nostoc sp. 'Lobaria pulmonaria (5183) cyanobiont']|uniref:hypothetical protein n=1 Tax=Nostoc sp. 'Lobaria pulmonaria (5183) cyanobiont' TaxID=1618022 RepID=UPI001319C88B|nr:hypothetical protein [Nostoc sp. 'Lobaria pulmonaria (5183) cyanobiont']